MREATPIKNQADIFPLPLSDFEYYAIRDETPDYPMVMILRIHLAGCIHEEHFTAALQTILPQNPLLQSQLQESDGQLRWQFIPDAPLPLQIVHNYREEPSEDCQQRAIDLRRECGAYFELRRSEKQSILICHFHHACVDGLGAIRFLADVFAEYGCAVSDNDSNRPATRKINHKTLLSRGIIPAISRAGGRQVRWTEWLKGPLRFLAGRVYSIPRRSRQPWPNRPAASVMNTRVLSKPVVRALKRLAGAQGMSTNDLCMMVYVQQLNRWTVSDPRARSNDLFRILMPISTRTADHDDISAANMISYVFQPILRRQCTDPTALARAIHNKSTQMLHDNESAVVLKLFSLLRRAPALFGVSQRLQPTFATAVLANVGELRRVFGSRFPLHRGKVVAGNVLVDRIDGIAPLRRNTNVVISFGSYAGELILNLRANPDIMTSDESNRFLDRVVQHLTALAASQSLTGKSSVAASPIPFKATAST